MSPAAGEPDLYTVLGVAGDATEAQILFAFRRRALVAHPDRGGDAETFRRLYRARATLVDPVRRAAYDRERAPRPAAGPGMGTGTGAGTEARTGAGARSGTGSGPPAPDPFAWESGPGPAAGPGPGATPGRSGGPWADAAAVPVAGPGFSWRRADRFGWWDPGVGQPPPKRRGRRRD